MQKHITAVAILSIVFGLFGLMTSSFVFILLAGGGLLTGEIGAFVIGSGLGTILAILIALFSVPGLIAGFGLFKRRGWARMLMLVLAFINLINIPFGTAFAIYAIWTLTHGETELLFQRPAHGIQAATAI